MTLLCQIVALWIAVAVALTLLWALIGYRTDHDDFDDYDEP